MPILESMVMMEKPSDAAYDDKILTVNGVGMSMSNNIKNNNDVKINFHHGLVVNDQDKENIKGKISMSPIKNGNKDRVLKDLSLDRDNSLENGNGKVKESLSSFGDVLVLDKEADLHSDIVADTKACIAEMMKIVIQKVQMTKIENTGKISYSTNTTVNVKHSGTPMQITNKMIEEEERYKVEEEENLEKLKAEALDELERTGKEERYQRLQNLLNRSKTYSTYLLGRINDRRETEQKNAEREEKRKLNEEQRKKEKEVQQKVLVSQNKRDVRGKQLKVFEDPSPDTMKSSRRSKRKTVEDEDKAAEHQTKKSRSTKKLEKKVKSYDENTAPTFEDTESAHIKSPINPSVRRINGEKVPEAQPRLLTGGVLRQYQIEGMEWLIGLYENGINGILADEMGLGKTLQSVALITQLIDQKVLGPFMICAPLSTLPNWIAEFKRFAPQIYTILYHGSKEERAEKRRKMMRIKKYSHGLCSLPVIITSYEIVMRDRIPLSSFNLEWKYMIVDEGHRLKNLNCKLIKELKLYKTGNRLLLTGTPLQNNLAELWSLLNFLLPDIFDDLSSFQRWFDFSAMSSSDFVADEQEASVLQTLHSILTPFLLRRLKTDVDLSIPPKREVLVYCPLTSEQQTYYRTTLDRSVLDMISEKHKTHEKLEFTSCGRPKRKSTNNVTYIDDDDEDYLLDKDALLKILEEEENRRAEAEALKNKKEEKKSIVNVKLVNIMMMLRKCCNHPYLLDYPYDAKTNQLIIDERLLNCAGKMLMLDKMLEGLKKRGHKVLLFSQMTLMLDIIVDYLGMKNWKYSRLDGTMKIEERFENIEKFNDDPENFIFLLSTRAGGLGLNLMMADTCIIYDSDWNPQVDLQAQDRCHRIGQTKPVMVYRLVTANTIDQRIIERAATKRRLEKMVIHKKRFKGGLIGNGITPGELIELLSSKDVSITLNTENIISDEELDQLLDRTDLLNSMKKESKVIHDDDVQVTKNETLSKPKSFSVVETSTAADVIF